MFLDVFSQTRSTTDILRKSERDLPKSETDLRKSEMDLRAQVRPALAHAST
jgi:hypothetical protein